MSKAYGPGEYRCPSCSELFHGLEMRCPTCGWAPTSRPTPSASLGDGLVVSMTDPGAYESKERMPIHPKDYGGPEQELPKDAGLREPEDI